MIHPDLTPTEAAVALDQERTQSRKLCGTCHRRSDSPIHCDIGLDAPRTIACPQWVLERDVRRWRDDL